MDRDSIIHSFIGFIVAIIPYLILIGLVQNSSFQTIISISGLITGFINAIYFKKKLENKNA